MYKNYISLQSEPHTAKVGLSVVLKFFFLEIHRELFFLDIKVIIAETSTEIIRNFVFLTLFKKGKILRKIWICLNNCFRLNQ